MLFSLLIFLIAFVAGVIYGVRNRNKPAPAYVGKSKSFIPNQFKEELAMKKETKVITERVKSAENAKIERVAAAKVEEEIGEELMPLKNQFSTIQTALNELQSSGQQNMNASQGQNQQQSNQLLQQMNQFSSQAQQQQQKTFQQLQQTIQ